MLGICRDKSFAHDDLWRSAPYSKRTQPHLKSVLNNAFLFHQMEAQGRCSYQLLSLCVNCRLKSH